MYLRNCWYAAAWHNEIGRDTLFSRRLLDEPIVFYRRADGAPVALEDRCCHRSLPLSKGQLAGDNLRCGYHGLLYDPDGNCIEVPGQTSVPPDASVRAYPVAERYKIIWIWMGDPARADKATIPNYYWFDDPDFLTKPGYLPLACSYRLMNDNLLDLSHLSFVHASTIGVLGNAQTPANVERSDDGVVVSRWMMDIPPSPTWKELGVFEGNVDRCQIVSWNAPGMVSIDVSGAPAGTGGPEGVRGNGIEMYNISIVTPETERSCHYFWSQALGPGINGDPKLNDFFYDQILNTFYEDKDVLEAQQRFIDLNGNPPPEIDINADVGALQARQILDRLIAAEAG